MSADGKHARGRTIILLILQEKETGKKFWRIKKKLTQATNMTVGWS
jgi:hypothetical protein